MLDQQKLAEIGEKAYWKSMFSEDKSRPRSARVAAIGKAIAGEIEERRVSEYYSRARAAAEIRVMTADLPESAAKLAEHLRTRLDQCEDTVGAASLHLACISAERLLAALPGLLEQARNEGAEQEREKARREYLGVVDAVDLTGSVDG